MLAAIPAEWRLFFEFLAHTGLRIGEAVGLTWEHVELGERPHVQVREQVYRGQRRRLKSDAGRRDIPLSAGMAERLLEHRPGLPLTVAFHSFRHTCASLLFDAGRNVKQVADWLGHADPSFTLRTYVHLLDAGVGDAAFFDETVGAGRPSLSV